MRHLRSLLFAAFLIVCGCSTVFLSLAESSALSSSEQTRRSLSALASERQNATRSFGNGHFDPVIAVQNGETSAMRKHTFEMEGRGRLVEISTSSSMTGTADSNAEGTSAESAKNARCRQMQREYGVMIGITWGRLPSNLQKVWSSMKCDMEPLEQSGPMVKLRKAGFNPAFALDVGANQGDWTREFHSHFPDTKVLMIDGVRNRDAEETAKELGMRYETAILSDTVRMIDWYEQGTSTGNSYFKESKWKSPPKQRQTKVLDDIVNEAGMRDLIEYIKLDVQGAELDILTGGKATLAKARYVQLEMPFAGVYNKGAPTFADYIAYMHEADFIPIDLLQMHTFCSADPEDCYIVQVDYLFERKNGLLGKQVQKILEPN